MATGWCPVDVRLDVLHGLDAGIPLCKAIVLHSWGVAHAQADGSIVGDDLIWILQFPLWFEKRIFGLNRSDCLVLGCVEVQPVLLDHSAVVDLAVEIVAGSLRALCHLVAYARHDSILLGRCSASLRPAVGVLFQHLLAAYWHQRQLVR